MTKKVSLLVLCLIMATCVFAGCKSGSKVVEDAVAEAQASIETLEKSFGGMMKIAITARGESVVYSYKYTSQIDADAAKTAIDAQESTLKTSMQGVLSPLKAAGVSNASIIVEYLNADGSMITSFEFK